MNKLHPEVDMATLLPQQTPGANGPADMRKWNAKLRMWPMSQNLPRTRHKQRKKYYLFFLSFALRYLVNWLFYQDTQHKV